MIQLNCNGLRYKITEVIYFMERHEIQVAAIQETKRAQNITLRAPGYDIIKKDRDRDRMRQTLAFIQRSSEIKYNLIDLPFPITTDIHLKQYCQ